MTVYTRIVARRLLDFINYPTLGGKDAEYDTAGYRYNPPAIKAEMLSTDDELFSFFSFGADVMSSEFSGIYGSRVSFDYKLSFDSEDVAASMACMLLSSAPEQGEGWELSLGGATGGTFDIGVSGDMRTLGYDVSAETLKATLIDVFGQGVVVVFKGAGSFILFFHWAYGATGLEADFGSLTGSDESEDLAFFFEYAATAGVFYHDYLEVLSPADWTSAQLAAAFPAEIALSFSVFRGSENHDVIFRVDNVEILPSLFLASNSPASFAGKYNRIPVGAMEIRGVFGYGPAFANIPVGAFKLYGRPPGRVWSLPKYRSAKTIYTLTITGAEDGLDDVEIPISNFCARLRSSSPSYLSCTIPNSIDWIAAISARSSGDLVLSKGYEFADGTRQLETIVRVDFETVAIDRGPRNDSGTVVGHRTITESSPKTRTATGVRYFALQHDGNYRVRADVDMFLRPGDTFVFGETDRISVDTVVITVGSRTAEMEAFGAGA
jgi:hypothetical protein